MILKNLNKPETLISYVKDRAGHDLRYAIDPSKISKELGWLPKTNFEKGIKLTIEWYINNQKWLDSVISGDYLDFYQKNYKDVTK
jgi:dTDP-glucose 4,6-dehydratase